jgi:uncharacterized repeat protein (TIGR03803 family)
LYGTAPSGGKHGDGVVFEVSTNGAETVLYDFEGGSDGAQPVGFLLRGSDGNLYGTASGNNGVVFKLSPKGKETVLYHFGNRKIGVDPQAGLIQDGSGNLYGTNPLGGDQNRNYCIGGAGCGAVFELKGK